MKHFQTLPKLSPGDQVGIISPSAGLPGLFPWVQDLGLERMRDIFGLIPVEYPTTRMMNASLEDRARDIMAAFADPNNKAVFASIGGNDQIKLIKYLDPQVFRDNPKPFFGYSDNTHLHNFLWNLGIPSYYGGGIMNQFGMNVRMFDMTIDSLKHALFNKGEFPLDIANNYNDEGLDWSVKNNLALERKLEPNDGIYWDGTTNAEGILWGGCVESLVAQMATAKYLPSDKDIDGTILVLETSENIPQHWIIEYLLVGLGERGWLDKFQAVLVGRPKAWEFNKQMTPQQKADYRDQQRKTVVGTIRQYNARIPIVQNIDFGHTDPQTVLPLGQKARVIVDKQIIYLSY
ncbi:LD-carboxypeptidase [Candidatus Saccharibacteria bacterium]|nr:MAG: LD-carboxypeptidase [Candidatus Saccharibacteria bacterium]